MDEWEQLPDRSTAQGAALAYFVDMDSQALRLLGIIIVEGSCPGSTYNAAELRRPIAEANRAAKKAGLAVP